MNCSILLSQAGNSSDTQDQQFATLPSANGLYHSNGSNSGSTSLDGWGLGYAHDVPVESTCSTGSKYSLSCEECGYLSQPYIINSPTQLFLQGNPSVKTMLKTIEGMNSYHKVQNSVRGILWQIWQTKAISPMFYLAKSIVLFTLKNHGNKFAKIFLTNTYSTVHQFTKVFPCQNFALYRMYQIAQVIS